MHDDGLEINTRQSAEGPEPKMPQAGDGSALSTRQAGDAKAADLLLPDGSPEWEAIGFDVLCSRCGYNLRTLTRPKCTECGLDFAWPDVLDASAFRSDFLFEHHWRTRPVRSLVITLWRSFRPRRFWASVSIHEHVNRNALWVFVLLAIFSFIVTLHIAAWTLAEALAYFLPPMGWNPNWIAPDPDLNDRLWQVEGIAREIAGLFIAPGLYYTWVPASPLTALLASLFLLRMLGQTLARHRIRGEHVLRVVAYAAVPSSILSALHFLLVIGVISIWEPPADSESMLSMLAFFLLLSAILSIPLATYLGAGLKHYLHIPRPRLVGATIAFVCLLLTLTVSVTVSTFLID